MKKRPHKKVSVLLLVVLVTGMGMACRIQHLEMRDQKEQIRTEQNVVKQNPVSQEQKIFGDEPENLYARSAVLMDADSGRILYGKESQVVRPMASTTKIMTCILALEYLCEHPEATAKVSERAASQPKVHLGMTEGETFYIKDLLYSLMLESHNDSAVAVAEGVAGSVEAFAEEMNKKAEAIGCKNTHFVTPNGLDEKDENGIHATTAEDLAGIMRYCIMISEERNTFLEITGTKSYQFQDAEKKRTFSCQNHNAFLDIMEGALSGKTGFTADAGYCYVGSLRRDDRTFIVSLLACGWPDHKGYKWKDTRKLMEYGLEHYRYQEIKKKMQMPEIEVTGGVDVKNPYQYKLSIPVKAADRSETSKILMREGEELETEMILERYKKAPLRKGAKVGKLTYYLDGYKVAEYDLRSAGKAEKRSFSWCMRWIMKGYLE